MISYDVPWNPVRLAQRVGRIDRLGCPHEEVRAFAFRPDGNIDEVLGLVRRIRSKLRAIRVIGGDAPRFTAKTSTSPAPTPNLDLAEQLRTFWRSHRGVTSKSPIAAVSSWSHKQRGAICAVRSGSTTVMVLIRDGMSLEIGGENVDVVLLEMLRDGIASGRAPSARRIREVSTIAIDAVRNRTSHVGRRQGSSLHDATRRVRQWLATQPAGATRDDVLSATALLQQIAEGDVETIDRIARRDLPLDLCAQSPPPDRQRPGVLVLGVLLLEPRLENRHGRP